MTGAEARLGAPPVHALRAHGSRTGDRVAITIVVALLAAFIALPLASVAYEALRAGLPAAFATFGDPDARSAIALTAVVALITVAINGVLGVLAAWTLAKYSFPCKAVVLAIIDLPLTVSPVVAGLAILLCFGTNAPAGAWLAAHGWKVAFAPPGIVLATIFVTFPYVARETLALMNETGRDPRRSGARSRRIGLADVLARHISRRALGDPQRAVAVQRACAGRIRARSRWFRAISKG